MASMASNCSPSDEAKKKRKRREREVRRKTGEVPEVQVEDLTARGHLALQTGRREEALSCFKKALKASIELQDSKVHRACSFNLGAAYVEAGKPQKGLDLLKRAQPGPRGDRVADLQFNLAMAHNALGQSQEAAGYFLRAAQLYRSQGNGASEGDACMEMGQCYVTLQDWTQAVQGFLRAGDSYRVAAMLDSAAIALKEAGSHMVQSDQFSQDDIFSVLTECLSLTDSVTDPRTLGELYLSVGVAYCQLRCFPEALRCFQQALVPAGQWPPLPVPAGQQPPLPVPAGQRPPLPVPAGQRPPLPVPDGQRPPLPVPAGQRPPLLATILHNLGATLNSQGQYKAALNYHRLAAGLYGSLGRRGDQARCFSNLAFACSQLGEEEEAAESFIHALQAFIDTEDYPGQCQVCEALGDSYLKARNVQKAVQYYRQAMAALMHCKDRSPAVQDGLVDRLTAALQQHPSLSLQRPRPLRPRPDPAPGQPGRDFNQQPHSPDGTRGTRGTGGTGGRGAVCEEAAQQRRSREERGDADQSRHRQEEAEDCGSAEGGVTEQPEYLSMLPGITSSYHHSDQSADLQHSELGSNSLNPQTPQTDSEPTVSQEAESPPTRPDNNKTMPLLSRWRSRFCSVM